ncbi:hypothetical protein ACCO45_012306 [Purpureocillium lilacinum]|uniref:Uncharacterized protein n=1 Tax=Purpureocillium lilacinum TaxID=33203 RepID=A0ACC4D8E9_PURLI
MLASIKGVGRTGRNAAERRRGVPIGTDYRQTDARSIAAHSDAGITYRRVPGLARPQDTAEGREAWRREDGEAKEAQGARRPALKWEGTRSRESQEYKVEEGGGGRAIYTDTPVMEGHGRGQANGGKGALPDWDATIPGGCNSVFQTTLTPESKRFLICELAGYLLAGTVPRRSGLCDWPAQLPDPHRPILLARVLLASEISGAVLAGTSPADTSPAGTSPAGTSPAGTSPAGTSPAGTSPAGK